MSTPSRVTQERVYNLFCYRRQDSDGEHDERRDGIPGWRLAQAVQWAMFRGFDSVLIDADDGQPSSTRTCTHHLCHDSACPGGCESPRPQRPFPTEAATKPVTIKR